MESENDEEVHKSIAITMPFSAAHARALWDELMHAVW